MCFPFKAYGVAVGVIQPATDSAGGVERDAADVLSATPVAAVRPQTPTNPDVNSFGMIQIQVGEVICSG